MALPEIDFLRGEPFSFAYLDLTQALRSGTFSDATATSFAVGFNAAGTRVVFHGSFVVNNDEVESGTVTGFDVFNQSTRVMTASGYALSYSAVNAALGDVQNDDQTPFRNLFFSEVVQVGSSETDHMYGASVEGTMLGLGGDDFLYGDIGKDTINGGVGDDWLEGREGKDILRGGPGEDTFAFTLTLTAGEPDRIAKFSHKDDAIFLDKGIFTALPDGALDPSVFAARHHAKTAEQHIIYNKDSGALFYDPDGAGGLTQIKFAVVSHHAKVTATDFDVGFVG